MWPTRLWGSEALCVVEGRPWPARNPARRAAEARRSRVARSAIARDAVGALDLGEAAPQAVQRPRRPPTETAEEPDFPDRAAGCALQILTSPACSSLP